MVAKTIANDGFEIRIYSRPGVPFGYIGSNTKAASTTGWTSLKGFDLVPGIENFIRINFLINRTAFGGGYLPEITQFIQELDKVKVLYNGQRITPPAAIELTRDGDLPSDIPIDQWLYRRINRTPTPSFPGQDLTVVNAFPNGIINIPSGNGFDNYQIEDHLYLGSPNDTDLLIGRHGLEWNRTHDENIPEGIDCRAIGFEISIFPNCQVDTIGSFDRIFGDYLQIDTSECNIVEGWQEIKTFPLGVGSAWNEANPLRTGRRKVVDFPEMTPYNLDIPAVQPITLSHHRPRGYLYELVAGTDIYGTTGKDQRAPSKSKISDPYLPTRSSSLESLRKFFPADSRASADDYSVYQQLINTFGLELDYLRSKTVKAKEAMSPISGDAREEAWIYSYSLDTGVRTSLSETGQVLNDARVEAFPEIIIPSGLKVPTNPRDIKGTIGGGTVAPVGTAEVIPVVAAGGTRDFFDDNLPTRISLTKQGSYTSALVYGTVALTELAKLGPVSLGLPTRLFVKVSSSSKLCQLDPETFELRETILKISGLNEFGSIQTETVPLFLDGVTRTRQFWKELLGISLINIAPEASADITVFLAPPAGERELDGLGFISTEQNETVPIYFSLVPLSFDRYDNGVFVDSGKTLGWDHPERNSLPVSVLRKQTHFRDPLQDILDGMDSRITHREQLIVAPHGPIGNPQSSSLSQTQMSTFNAAIPPWFERITSIASDPKESLLYAINDQYLFIIDKRDEMPGSIIVNGKSVPFLTLLNDLTPDPELKFFVLRTEEIKAIHNLPLLAGQTPTTVIECSFVVEIDAPREELLIKEWAWSFTEPDGTVLYLDENKELIYPTLGETPVKVYQTNTQPIDFWGIEDDNFTLRYQITPERLWRYWDEKYERYNKHAIIGLEVVLTTGDIQKFYTVVDLPIKQPLAKYNLIGDWGPDIRLSKWSQHTNLHGNMCTADGSSLDVAAGSTGRKARSGAFDFLHVNEMTFLDHRPLIGFDTIEAGALSLYLRGEVWKVDFKYDYYMCDFEADKIYFREKYDSVEIDWGHSD